MRIEDFHHHHVSTRGHQAMASHTCDLMRLIWSTMASRVLEENVVEAEEPANTVVKDTVFFWKGWTEGAEGQSVVSDRIEHFSKTCYV